MLCVKKKQEKNLVMNSGLATLTYIDRLLDLSQLVIANQNIEDREIQKVPNFLAFNMPDTAYLSVRHLQTASAKQGSLQSLKIIILGCRLLINK